MTYELKTLDRAFEVCNILARQSPMRLTDLAVQLGTSQTSMLRTLRVLERHGYIRRAQNGADYYLGARLVELGHAALATIDVVGDFLPSATDLSRLFGATVHIGMLHADAVTVVAKIDEPEARVTYSSVGTRMPLHATAAGKAALALSNLTAEEVAQRVEPLQQYTKYSIANLDQLLAELRRTADRGFSTEFEEYNIGFGCVGSALRVGDEIYTVSVSAGILPETEMLKRGDHLLQSIEQFLAEHHGAIRGLRRLNETHSDPHRSSGPSN